MLKGLNQKELQGMIAEKVTDLHELIVQIDEETEYEVYGTIMYGIEYNGKVDAGGTQYGSAVDIAQVLINSEELSSIQTAIVALALGRLEGVDE
jgi:hypothetical protein